MGLRESRWHTPSYHRLRRISTTYTSLSPSFKRPSKTARGSALAAALLREQQHTEIASEPESGHFDKGNDIDTEGAHYAWAESNSILNPPRTSALADALTQAVEAQALESQQYQQSDEDQSMNKAIWNTLQEKLMRIKTFKDPEDGDYRAETSDSRSRGPKEKTPKTPKEWKKALDVRTVVPGKLELTPVDEPVDVAKLSYGLDKVLFNPGVYQLVDSRSGVFNFDPYLANIMPVEQFDFDALKAYITSSKDVKLREMCSVHGAKYCGSTSSMTAVLSHFHFLLSSWRPLNYAHLSQKFPIDSHQPTLYHRGPAAAYARLKDGVYAIDADKEFDKETVLSMLGKSMEKLLTLPKEEFEKYRKTRSHMLTEEEKNADEAYHYTTLGDFMMRSQLDAHDSRLPGTGVFDLKTRAVLSIRMNISEYEEGRGYEIRDRLGTYNSFEREYHDMIRSAFLKYSLQVRMGRMDGIFVAFHNTQRIFGFQYISLEEMDLAIHDTDDRRYGDQEFKASVTLLNELLNRATKRYPGRSLRLHVETRPTTVPLTYFIVEPVDEKDIKESQEESKRQVERVEKEIMDQMHEAAVASEQEEETQSSPEETLVQADTPADNVTNDSAQRDQAWMEMMSKIEESVESESLGVQFVREAFQDALESSHEGELDTLMEDIKVLISASPGIKEISEVSEADLKEVDPHFTFKSQESGVVPMAEESVTEFEDDVAGEGAEAESAPLEEKNTLKSGDIDELAAVDEQSTNDSVESDQVDVVESNSSPASSIGTYSKSNEQHAKDLKDLIMKVTGGMDDKDGGQLRAFMAEMAAKAKQTNTTTTKTMSKGSEDTFRQQTRELIRNDKKVPDELFGMYVTIRNIVDNEAVARVDGFVGQKKEPKWKVEYNIEEMSDVKAFQIYAQMRQRRKEIQVGKADSSWRNKYLEMLKRLSKDGERYRERMNKKQEGKPVNVAWDEKTSLPAGVLRSGVIGDIS